MLRLTRRWLTSALLTAAVLVPHFAARDALSALDGSSGVLASTQAADAVVVYLVRHAEAEPDGTRDPALGEVGRERAERLASVLRDAGITHIHSSDFQRTQQTAAPASEALGIPVMSYDPRALEPFADELRATPGRHLVVGHSNTTGVLAGILEGEAGAAFDETEFDRLYVVVLDPEAGGVRTLLRFNP